MPSSSNQNASEDSVNDRLAPTEARAEVGAAEAPTLVPQLGNAAETATLVPAAGSAAEITIKSIESTQVDLVHGLLGPYREVKQMRAWKAGSSYSGTVYFAVHTRLRRQVELLVLDEGSSDAARDAFLQTARKAAAINHPNVETGLLEAASYGGLTFVARDRTVLEPLTGFGPRAQEECTLEPLYSNREMALAILEAARGLAAIHGAGLRHGHITPAVVCRGTHGQVCLTALREGSANSNLAPPMSEVIAPEAVQKDIADLGASFVELVCGKVPATGEERGAFSRDLRGLNPGLPRSLAYILERCLTPDPTIRFQSAHELAEQLEKQTKFKLLPIGWRNRIGSQLTDCLIFAPLIGGAYLTLLVYFGWIPTARDQTIVYGLILVAMILWETLLGWTPGRRMRGFWLLDVSGEPPATGKLFARSVFRMSWLVVFVFLMEQSFVGLWEALDPTTLPQSELREQDFPHFRLTIAFPLLAVIGLYLTSLRTPNRKPLHDYLTNISWYARWRADEDVISETDKTRRGSQTAQTARVPTQSIAAQQLGRMDQYELRGLLGQGGMGSVFDAYDTLLERRVAIKMISSSTSVTPAALQRFEREARLAAQLSHPNVAEVFGAGEIDGQLYMVMEFVEGENLQELVQHEGALPLARAWDYLKQTALALREAHRCGIVHRDIKPANLMLNGSNVVKVTDFGISRALGDDEELTAAPSPTTGDLGHASLTKTGALLGTPMYLSPEQARGEKLDQRSDIYSLGMTFYFLLSGKAPFESGDVYDLVMRQCNEEPASLKGKVTGWTPNRDYLLQRLIAKDRTSRFQDYDELLEALEIEGPKPSVLAGLRARFSAIIVDVLLATFTSFGMMLALISALPNSILLSGRFEQIPNLVFCLFVCSVYIIGIGRWGATPGKWNFRLRVVRTGQERVGYWRAFLRFLVFDPPIFWVLFWSASAVAGGANAPAGVWIWVNAAGSLLVGIATLTSACLVLFGKQRRGLHDWVADTMVIQIAETRSPRNWFLKIVQLHR